MQSHLARQQISFPAPALYNGGAKSPPRRLLKPAAFSTRASTSPAAPAAPFKAALPSSVARRAFARQGFQLPALPARARTLLPHLGRAVPVRCACFARCAFRAFLCGSNESLSVAFGAKRLVAVPLLAPAPGQLGSSLRATLRRAGLPRPLRPLALPRGARRVRGKRADARLLRLLPCVCRAGGRVLRRVAVRGAVVCRRAVLCAVGRRTRSGGFGHGAPASQSRPLRVCQYRAGVWHRWKELRQPVPAADR